MKIVVLVKQVPDTSEIKIDKEHGTLIRTGIPSIINPDDQAALEIALKIKDLMDAHITVLSMGPTQVKKMHQKILAMGVDETILVTDRKFAGADTKATSYTISAQLKNMEYDLIIAGRQAIDGDTAQVGPQVAEILNLPQITYVDRVVELDSDKVVCRKSLEDSYQVVEAKLPALITTLSEAATLRYPKIYNINKAINHELKVITTDDLDIDLAQIGLKGSPTKVKRTYTKEITTTAEMFEGTAREAAAEIFNTMKEKNYI